MNPQSNPQPQGENASGSIPPKQPIQMMPPKKKSGVGKKILMIILALLVLGGVAYGTYYFTKQQAEEDAAAVIEPLQAQVAELEAKIAKQESTESESAEGSYLEIEQWGVRLTPTDSAMSYRIENIDGVPVAYLTNEATKTIPGCEDAELAAIGRYSEKQEEDAFTGAFVAEIGQYYYYVSSSNGTCAKDQADATFYGAQRDALRAAAKTLEASEE